MDRKKELADRATEHFRNGYNCAQSILLAVFEDCERKSELIPKIATGFGAGIGRCGSVCGAIAGGVMAIGIKHGTNEPSLQERLKSYELASQLYKRFERQHGDVLCRKLIGYDLSDPLNREKAQDGKVFEKKCSMFIKTVVEILADLNKQIE